jgi:SPASM domain peptide maturase of grasp-with-spasm system
MKNKKHILLFENCRLIKGYHRTCLVDVQRLKFELVDNEIFEIFNKKNLKKTINEILKEYSGEDQNIIDEYFGFLIENEYAFECYSDEVNFFPQLNLSFEMPAIISNCIIDFIKIPQKLKYYEKFINDLDKAGCENIQIRVFDDPLLTNLAALLELFDHTIIYRIELLLKHYESFSDEKYKEILQKHVRINEVIIHSATKNTTFTLKTSQRIIMTKDIINNEKSCGVISYKYFNTRIEHVLESINYNSCLNRKISVDTQGQIKNCPAFKKGYGTISSTTISDVLSDNEFKKVWDLTKDKIKVCKDCEFRYICTDCRAFLGDDLSLEKPSKCNYNPYLEI